MGDHAREALKDRGRERSLMRFSVASLLVVFLISLPLQAGEHSFQQIPGLKKGMSRETVKKILGEPRQVKKQNTCWGFEERWWYEREGLRDKVLLFTDGKLDKIETVKIRQLKTPNPEILGQEIVEGVQVQGGHA